MPETKPIQSQILRHIESMHNEDVANVGIEEHLIREIYEFLANSVREWEIRFHSCCVKCQEEIL